jgi:hypothetical protein
VFRRLNMTAMSSGRGVALAVLFVAAGPATAEPPAGHYCNLKVFSKEEGARLKELSPLLAAAVTRRDELADGYAFAFDGKMKWAGEWLDDVRRCCPTVHFDVSFPPQQGAAVLKITGEHDAKVFIREEFALLFGDKR